MNSVLCLNNYKSLLSKCNYEYKSLEKCDKNLLFDYTIINIIVGLNHLFEWYLKDEDITLEQRIDCIFKFSPYKNIERIPKEIEVYYKQIDNPISINYNQYCIRLLANRIKHLEKKENENISKKREKPIEYGSSHYGDETQYNGFKYYSYTVSIDNKIFEINKTITELIIDWNLFIGREN